MSATVNLAYSSSPQVSMLPIVYFKSGSVEQGFFYPAILPTEDPLIFSFGNSIDYRSSQAGTPQVIAFVVIKLAKLDYFAIV